MYWADITIDEQTASGRIMVASDFGHWQHFWGACGKGFKQFLISLGKDYVADKFGASHWLDTDKTIKMFKENILSNLRTQYIGIRDAREMWEEIKGLSGHSDNEFTEALGHECPKLMKHYDWCPDMCYSASPQFTRFWNEVWPAFIEVLKSEINS